MKMGFEIGNSVVVNGFHGIIVKWYFDEGNVWLVNFNGKLLECCDEEMIAA
jgi:hypothetical protein